MRYLWGRFAGCVLCFIGFFWLFSTIPVAAQTQLDSEQVYFLDEGEQLSESVCQEILTLLEETAEDSGMYIGVWIGSTAMGESATISACDDLYDETFGVDTDGILLYLDCSDEADLFDYISTSGKGQFYYTNDAAYDRISRMWENMDAYLARGEEDLFGAISQFCSDVVYYAEIGAPSDTYYTYNSDTGMYLILEDDTVQEVSELPRAYTRTLSDGKIVGISALIGLLAGCITFLCIRLRYRFKKAGDTAAYLQNGGVRFTQRTDRFLRQYHTRTRVNTNNGGGIGGGGGFSHSSGGGGSHGGGGHHR